MALLGEVFLLAPTVVAGMYDEVGICRVALDRTGAMGHFVKFDLNSERAKILVEPVSQ